MIVVKLGLDKRKQETLPMNKNILPESLKKGDKVTIISPSGSINNEYIDAAKSLLEAWELQVTVSKYARNKAGRFCGNIEERLSDIQSAMDDEECKMILCSRGGYGIVHLLDKLRFDKIKQHPKWLVGYSDITALHQVFLHEGLMSLHAPMAKHIAEEGEDTAIMYLKDTLFGDSPQYTIDSHQLNVYGNTEGILFGGNLAVLSSLMGSKYTRFPSKEILFLEDIGERPYQIDRMMWNLKIAGVLANISGLIIGQFTDYEEDPLMYTSVYQSIHDMVSEYNIPVAFNFPVGHVKDNYPLLHGCQVKLSVVEEQTSLIFQI